MIRFFLNGFLPSSGADWGRELGGRGSYSVTSSVPRWGECCVSGLKFSFSRPSLRSPHCPGILCCFPWAAFSPSGVYETWSMTLWVWVGAKACVLGVGAGGDSQQTGSLCCGVNWKAWELLSFIVPEVPSTLPCPKCFVFFPWEGCDQPVAFLGV